MRAGRIYRCPACGEGPPVPAGNTCPRCDVPMVDEHGLAAPPQDLRPPFAPSRRRVAVELGATAGMVAGLVAGVAAELVAGVALLPGALIFAGAASGAAAVGIGRGAAWLRRRARDRAERRRLERVATGTAPPPEGMRGLLGRVHVLRAVGHSGGRPIAVRRRDGVTEAGRFAVVGDTCAALVDDDWLELLGDTQLCEGDFVSVVGPVADAPTDLPSELAGYRESLRFLALDGRPDAPIRCARASAEVTDRAAPRPPAPRQERERSRGPR